MKGKENAVPRARKMAPQAIAALALMASTFGAANHARAELIYGYGIDGAANVIFSFDSSSPGTVINRAPITGLGADTLQAIDIRPANSQLYGFSNSNNVYIIDPLTGVATFQSNVGPAASGNQGIDFNPVPDRLRIVTSDNQNLRANVDTGATLTDTNLAYAAGDINAGNNPTIVGSGYTNNTGPSPRTPPPGTTLYDIDAALNVLATQAPPNNGTLNTVGNLGIDIGNQAEFDISGFTGSAYLSDVNGGSNISSFYTVNLGTGAASFVGNFDPTVGQVNGIAAPAAVPEPGTMAMLGIGLAGLFGARRRRKKLA